MSFLDDVFGVGGLLAKRLPAYEPRPGQMQLARAVERALREGSHVLGEGPCGTGKSLAYAVPAIEHAHRNKKCVVIATANIALQEQLVRSDLPLLRQVLPWPFSFALLKGRNNFLCLERAATAVSLWTDDGEQRLLAWAKTTDTGDKSELGFEPNGALWSRYSVTPDECVGRGCAHFQPCFYEQAKRRAKEATIVVTNYHVLFAHLALRRDTGEDLLLPELDALVLDEAHEAAAIAREFFGFALSEMSFKRLQHHATTVGSAAPIDQAAHQFFLGLATEFPDVDRVRLKTPHFIRHDALGNALTELGGQAKSLADDEDQEQEHRALARTALRVTASARGRLEEAVALGDADKVYWVERDQKHHLRLRGKPLAVGPLLAAELFAKTRSVTLTSATLTTGGSFAFLRRELGVPDSAHELCAESPFDFQRQALLVVPSGIPAPNEPGFVEQAARVVERVIALCRGRTLGLFTSYKNLNAVYQRVVDSGHRILRQGDLPRSDLAKAFKQDVGSVLFGTDSFWTGIDVPGEALTGLVIDRLPFPSPDDPLFEALAERDRKAFANHMLPRAIMKFRQGVGRLIRTSSDVGVIVVLDRRLVDERYGADFLRSLPRMRLSRRLEDIAEFLGAR